MLNSEQFTDLYNEYLESGLSDRDFCANHQYCLVAIIGYDLKIDRSTYELKIDEVKYYRF